MNCFVPWIGGKSRLAKTICSLLPEDRTTYIEVFGGGAKVLFKKDKLAGEVEVYNDLHSELINLFRIVKNDLTGFIKRQEYILCSRSEYKSMLEMYKAGTHKDDLDRAVVFYYLVQNSFGSGITTGWAYSRVRPPKYPACLDSLAAIKARLLRVYIEHLSFEKLIPKWDSKTAVFYVDPPY